MTAREWLEKAKKEKFAIGAFNVGNLETLKAVVLAAANKKSPVIIESSPGETSWMGAENIVDLAKNYSSEYGIPILVNLDHGGSLQECLKAIGVGYDLIHFDGSKLPLEQNTEIAKKVVEEAYKKGLVVEGEMDHIEGSSELHQGSAQDLASKIPMTDPEKAKQFVDITGIDILAAFFGNLHGKFSAGDEKLHLEVLEKLGEVLPNTFFSLHGGSGIPDDDVKEAIKRGIVKVNINTEMRQVFKENLEDVLQENKDELAMYKLEQSVVDAVRKVVEEKIVLFGSDDKI